MAWTGVITNAGANLLDQWALGGTLTITSAATGTGTVDTAALVNQTNLKSRKQTASIISKVRKSSGVKVKLQITAPSTGYTLNQYGVWAKLGSGAAVLLALFQREDGVPIPSSAETPEFVYTLYALLTISNTGTLEVTVDTSALVSQSTLEEAMATKVDKVSGKGLSTEDYTTAEKEKLAGIEAQANKYTHPSYTARTGKPTANLTPGFGDTVTVSQITSDASGHVTGATDRTIKIPATAATTSAAGLMSAADKTKLNGIATGAEVNQNAFSNVKVGSTTVAADAKTDTLELVAGSNVTLTLDATNDKVTIAATDTTYSSKAAASGGTAVSLVTTGEKYTWNSKANDSHTHAMGDVTGLTDATTYGPTNLVSFQGSADFPLKTCQADIQPIQAGSGNPSPSNVRAISGRTSATVTRAGKNLCPRFTGTSSNGVTYTIDEDGSVTANGTTTAASSIGVTATLPAGSYCVSGAPDDSRSANSTLDIYVRVGSTVVARDYKNVDAATRRFTLTEPTEISVICRVRSSAGFEASGAVFHPQIEAASTPTAYEPYAGISYPFNWQSAAGTIYGGTLDVLTGLLTVTHAVVDLGDLTWTYNSTYSLFVGTGINNSPTPKAGGYGSQCKCSSYKSVTVAGVDNINNNDLLLNMRAYSLATKYVIIKDTRYTAAATFKTAVTGQTLVYPLATPTTYQLTPHQVTALLGQTNIWADCGQTTAEYGEFPGTLQRELDRHYVTAGKKSGTTLGTNATAEGSSTTASGDSSHAEGWKTTASELASHAEGSETVASGEYSHAEGWGTKTTTPYAHAEGCATEASGTAAHAEGYYTIANRDYQHVFGQYNASSVNSVEIVGWGTSSTRKNIRTLDQSGNMTIAGTLTQSSDARLKDVQGEVPDVSGIRAVRFRWNDVNGEHDDKDHIGYIAQEVEKIAPFLVGDDSNGYKSLDYIALLCAKVEYLERRVAELEGR